MLLAILFVVSLYAAYHPKLLISKTVVEGNKTVSDFDIREVVNGKLAGKFLNLYPRRHALLYPREEVKKALAKAFPRLRTIELSQPNLRELNIVVTERRGDYLWCHVKSAEADHVASPPDNDCYFADDTGFVFSPAPRFSNSLYFEFITASSTNPIGRYPIPAALFQKITAAQKQLSAALTSSFLAGQKVFQARPGELNDWNFKVGSKAGGDKSWEIRMDLGADLNAAVFALASVLADPDFIKETENNHGDLEYLDLRFAPKVFYRYNTK